MNINHLISIINVNRSSNNSFYVCDFDVTYHNGKTERKNGDLIISSLYTKGKILSFFEYADLYEVLKDQDVMITIRGATTIEFIPLDEILSFKFKRMEK